MAAPTIASACFSSLSPLSPRFSNGRPSRILAMAPKQKAPFLSSSDLQSFISLMVNRYDDNWKKQWYGAGLFAEGSEELSVDVVKKLETRKVLSGVEKSGLLSKAEELGITLSSIERLGFLSKAEELGLLSLLERAAGFSPSALASVSLPLLVAAVAAIVLIPDDSAALVAAQAFLSAALGVVAAGLFVGSVVLGGLQESD
ncbi:unnamed protein product [Musa acuminata subsp. malaccensis]|uniref:(wild Malaysian banana) hypothetical protein n=1 Tax=Musa acuminata subsp. malaccensis TaxID=214687 RepID=A0A8D7F4Y4_MUSAM|nr:unnamed protein product [Musa acuminata subsp. malaccensis]